ncbi:MAG: protease inhibitor I42 family protein [Ignavibacteriales bacterium]
MLQINESSDGQEITLPIDQMLEICLRENPTTGFRWSLEAKGEPACVFVKDFFESVSDAPGRGGNHHWQFQTARVGLGTIELSYLRSWEKEKAPAQTFTLRVRVLK